MSEIESSKRLRINFAAYTNVDNTERDTSVFAIPDAKGIGPEQILRPAHLPTHAATANDHASIKRHQEASNDIKRHQTTSNQDSSLSQLSAGTVDCVDGSPTITVISRVDFKDASSGWMTVTRNRCCP